MISVILQIAHRSSEFIRVKPMNYNIINNIMILHHDILIVLSSLSGSLFTAVVHHN